MKLALISDTHGIHLPDIDPSAEAVIHAGDVGPDKNAVDWLRDAFSSWAKAFGKPVYLTWGNHDFIGERLPLTVIADYLPPNVRVLVDEQVEIGGKKVWFSPWSPTFGGWAFMVSENQLRGKYAAIPEDTEIIVSHSPPYGFGDLTPDGVWGPAANVGSKALADRFFDLPFCDLLVCGHIHNGYGVHKTPVRDKKVVNVAQLNDHYTTEPARTPVYVTI